MKRGRAAAVPATAPEPLEPPAPREPLEPSKSLELPEPSEPPEPLEPPEESGRAPLIPAPPEESGQAQLIPAPPPVVPSTAPSAAVPVARRPPRPTPDGQWQLSIFGVEALPPSADDLEGLLAGAGQVTRMGGTARVSIVVDEPWRAAVLTAECRLRGLTATCEPATVEGHIGFRTAYSTALAPLGARWLRGAVKAPPPGFALDGRRLRLWVAAAGSPDGVAGYVLRLGPSMPGGAAPGSRLGPEDDPVWITVGAALAAAGLPAALLGPRAGGPAYRIVGRRRIARLFELIGEPPRQVPAGMWPASLAA